MYEKLQEATPEELLEASAWDGRNEMPKIVYVFDCPVHGEESQMFCFRAGDPKLISRWKRYEVVRTELPVLYDPVALKKVQEIQRRLREN